MEQVPFLFLQFIVNSYKTIYGASAIPFLQFIVNSYKAIYGASAIPFFTVYCK